MDLLGPVPDRIGRYVVEERLGAGGMAEAFLAYVEGVRGFKRAVVLKRLLRHMWADPNAEQMFLREAKVGMRLSHENIVRVFDLGEHEGALFMAMEYVAGMTLRAAAKRAWALERQVPLPVVLRAMADAARGLHHAHTLVDARGQPDGMIHRDISPDNLMMSREGVTKILDFGIVKRTTGTEPITRTGEIKGKIGYMAPEQLEGEEMDHRVDLFALGVTFYWLLAGHRPFHGKNEIMTIRAVLEDEPKPLRELDASLPPEVDELVLDLLAKKKEDRPATAEEVVRRIEGMVGRTDPTGEASSFIDDMLGFGEDKPEKKPRPISWDGAPPPDDFGEFSEVSGPSANDGTRVTLRELPSLPAGYLASDASGDAFAPMDTDAHASPADTVLNPAAPSNPETTQVTASIDQTLEQPSENTVVTAPAPSVSELGNGMAPGPTLITDMPPRVTSSRDEPTHVVTRRRMLASRSRRKGWLIAAAALVLVVAGVGVFFASAGGPGDDELLWGDQVVDAKPSGTAAGDSPSPDEPPVQEPAVAQPANEPPADEPPADELLAEGGGQPEPDAPTGADEELPEDDEPELAVAADEPADPVTEEPNEEDGAAESPRPAKRASTKRARTRRVVVTAPDHIKWVDGRGRPLGTGSGTLQVPAAMKRVRAVDRQTGGRVSVPVKSRIFWNDLPRGRMAFVVLPWAKVTIGRTSLGTTPLKPVDLVAGTYTATLTYKDEKVNKRIVVRPRADATIKHDFRK